MSEEYKLTEEQQRYLCIDALKREAARNEAHDPATVANLIVNRKGVFDPTPEACKKLVSEFAVVRSECFASIPKTELQAATSLSDAQRLANESGVRPEHVDEIARLLAQHSGSRLQALSELRRKRPDLFQDEDSRTLSQPEIARLSPAEYAKIRRENPRRLGLRR